MKALRLASLVLVPVLACAAVPAQAGAPSFGVVAAKKAKGPYTDYQDLNMGNKEKTVYWKVVNPTGADIPIVLTDSSTTTDGLKFKWYEGFKPKGSKDITNQVEGSGHEFELESGATEQFSTSIKKIGSPGEACLYVSADGGSAGIRGAGFAVGGVC